MDDENNPNLTDQKKKCKILISRITPNSETKASIESGDLYTIHYLIDNSIIYICICNKSYPKKLAFSYLLEISHEFFNSHGNEALSNKARPYGFNSFDNFYKKQRKFIKINVLNLIWTN